MDGGAKGTRFRRHLLEWGRDNLREFPWRERSDAYGILIAELLLKQTTAEKVVPVYESFLEEYPAPADLREADEAALTELIRPLGLYNQRVDAIKAIAEEIHPAGIPGSIDELADLPYVGPYSANAILCFGHNKCRPIVDVNVIRIYRRVFDLPEDWYHRTDEMWDFAEEMLPERDYQLYNLSLLDFGAMICTSQSPACEDCFASSYCSYYLQEANGK